MLTLNEFVDNAAPGERGNLILRANRLIVEAGYQDHIDQLEFILSQVGGQDTDNLVMMVEDCLLNFMLDVVTDNGIAVDDDISFYHAILLFQTLETVDAYTDYDGLHIAINEDNATPIEKFVNVVGEVTGEDVTEMLPFILAVSENVISAIEHHLSVRDLTHTDEIDVSKDTRLIKRFLMSVEANQQHLMGVKPLKFYQLLENEFRMGFDADVYMKHMFTDQMSLSKEDTLNALAAFFASGKTSLDIQTHFGDMIDSYCEDVGVVQRHVMEASRLLTILNVSVDDL